MSNINRRTVLTAIFTVALLFAAALGVDAQSNKPINDDDIVACIQVGPELWVTHLGLQGELEIRHGQSAVVEPMGLLLQNLPVAAPGRTVRFEGAVPSSSVSDDLDALGYTQSQFVTPELPSALVAVVRSL